MRVVSFAGCFAALRVAAALRLSPSALSERFTQLDVARAATSPARLAVTNPTTGGQLALLPDCGEASARLAIDRAAAALPSWRSRTAHERCAVLRRWHDLIVAHTEELAQLMTLECGKPLAEARGEVAYGASFVIWYAEEAKRVNGALLPSSVATRRTLVLKQPLGVVGASKSRARGFEPRPLTTHATLHSLTPTLCQPTKSSNRDLLCAQSRRGTSLWRW